MTADDKRYIQMKIEGFLERAFGYNPIECRLSTEIVAGITTFLTMSYILAVNPDIFRPLAEFGMDTGAVFTATALAAAFGTLMMAFLAKMPIALAPGMGLNAFFVYTVCISMGYSWRFALTAVLIEGVIFVILTLANIRAWIVDTIPQSIKKAIGAGIGLFIALVGLQNSGIIVNSESTVVTLGDVTQGTPLLALIGLVLTTVLMARKVPCAMFIGIIVTALIGIPMGITKWQGIVSMPPSVGNTFCQFEWGSIFCSDMVIVVFTMLFLDIFDTMGSLVAICNQAGLTRRDGSIPNMNRAFLADSIATVAGAALGTNTTTTYIESASGVTAGGKSGLTAATTSVCFLLALFFSPLFLAISSAATAPVLIIVGLLMMKPFKDIYISDLSESVPAFITMIGIPLAYSISDGIMLGVISYTVINALCGKFSKVSVPMWILTILFVLNYIFL